MDETEVTMKPDDEAPRVLDTYAVSYAFMLLFLVPGVLAIAQLPFRTYTFSYVSLVTVPFLLGIALTFFTDSRDPFKTVALRILILTPLIVISGVTVMFLSTFLLLPVNAFLAPEHRAIATPVAGAILVALVSPLVVGIVRRLRRPIDARSMFQALAMLAALALAAVVVYVSVFQVGRLGEIADLVRKDLVIYIIGGLVWYLPSFGISAGVWRRLGLV
ncbi:MAG: hypothetical protein U1E26_01275 [Coriobacteriia bacterium]|nr:hypothetical protein [Coriobacteriia bacterium]